MDTRSTLSGVGKSKTLSAVPAPRQEIWCRFGEDNTQRVLRITLLFARRRAGTIIGIGLSRVNHQVA